MDVRAAFGKRVREFREELGVSQEELADRVGLDRTYISAVERGKYNVSLINICKLALVLKKQPSELLVGVNLSRLPTATKLSKRAD